MPQQESGNWKPYNVKTLEQNTALVFKTGDIRKLNGVTYHFITMQMGFIAHYDLAGFQNAYQDIKVFRETLLTSEYSQDPDYNMRRSFTYERDRDFIKWYGESYCQSVGQGVRAIIKAAQASSEQTSLSLG